MAGELAGYADDLDADPLRLAAVEERRAALTQLTRKYGEDVAAVLDWAEESAARLAELEGDDDRIGELTAERDALRAELTALAQQLTDARTDAAKRFADAVTEELAELAMPHARVTFALRRSDAADEAAGLELDGRTVAFGRTAPTRSSCCSPRTPARQPGPIAKGASGGELSRVMLAVEVVFAGSDPVPTYLFDEVDAGVGGKAAVEVGPAAGAAGQVRAGRRRHPPAAGRRVRRPAPGGGEDRRRLGHPQRRPGDGGRGPGARAVPDARRPGGLPAGPGARRGTAGGRPRRHLTAPGARRIIRSE